MIPDDNDLNHYTRRKLLLSSDLAPPLGITAAELFRDTADDDSSLSDFRPNDDDGNDYETSLLTMKYYKDHCYNYDLIFHSDKLGFDISMVSPLPTGDEVFVKRVSSTSSLPNIKTAHKETIQPFDVLTYIHGFSLPMILRAASSLSGRTSNSAKLDYIAKFIFYLPRPLTIRFARRNLTDYMPPPNKWLKYEILNESVDVKLPCTTLSVFKTVGQNKPRVLRDRSNVVTLVTQSAESGCMKSGMKKKLVTRKSAREAPPKSVVGGAKKKLKYAISTKDNNREYMSPSLLAFYAEQNMIVTAQIEESRHRENAAAAAKLNKESEAVVPPINNNNDSGHMIPSLLAFYVEQNRKVTAGIEKRRQFDAKKRSSF